jgi:3-hydroxyisobutyrate dehydrogenase-like beta-hydroxyacid dehydrogenase
LRGDFVPNWTRASAASLNLPLFGGSRLRFVNFAVASKAFCGHSVRLEFTAAGRNNSKFMSRRTRKNVGVIGLSVIGSRVTANLRRKGFHVFVWNDIPQPVPNFVGAPAELAEMCDFIEIFVPDDDAVLQVCRQLAPTLGPRHVVLVHSTVTSHTMRDAAGIVERRGAHFLEAPFSGGKDSAERGELIFYVGGDVMALQEARPILEANAREIMMIGEVGQATAIKVAVNIITAASVQAAAEALAMAHATGLPPERLFEALQEGSSFSKTLAAKVPKMIETNFDPHFSIKQMFRDIQIAHQMGRAFHLELTVTTAVRDRLLEQMQRGFGDEDYSAVARKYFEATAPAKAEAAQEAIDQPQPEHLPSPSPPVSEPSAPAPQPTAAPFITIAPQPSPPPQPSLPTPGPTPEFTPIAATADEPTVAEDREAQPQETRPAASHTSAPAAPSEPQPKMITLEGPELHAALRRLLQRGGDDF